MPKVFTAQEFISALANDQLRSPTVVTGMVKLHDQESGTIELSAGASCGAWTVIPADMIEQVEFLRTVRCQDHEHPLVRITLKEPDATNTHGLLFAALLRNSIAPDKGHISPAVPKDDDDRPPHRISFAYCFHCADGRMGRFTATGYAEYWEQVEFDARQQGYRFCNERVLNYQPC